MRTICEALEDAAKKAPQKGFRFLSDEAPTGEGNAVSFEALFDRAKKVAAAFHQLGLRKGDRVALIIPNNDEFVLCFLGALWAGVIAVPIYPPLGLGQLGTYLANTLHTVTLSGAKLLVTTGAIRRFLGSVEAKSSLLRIATLEEVFGIEAPEVRPPVSLEDVAFLQFTSGSTSRPKGVTLTHGNLAANIHCIMEVGLAANEDDVGVSWLPLYHDMGLIGFVLAPLFHEVPVVFLSPLAFLKRPSTWFSALSRYRGTITYAPNFAYALCQKRIRADETAGISLASVRVAGCGAEPIRAETLLGFAERFSPLGFRQEAFVPSYGMAESSLAVSFSEVGKGVQRRVFSASILRERGAAAAAEEGDPDALSLVSCGRAFPQHDIQIVPPGATEPAPPLQVGEIVIRGPSVMSGYFEDEEKTREAWSQGYLRTGDLGFLCEGELFVCGRIKELIIVSGRNYYPQDIEWIASAVPGVRKGNVIAFGLPSASQDRERVALCFEVSSDGGPVEPSVLSGAVRKAVQEALGLTLDEVLPLPAGALPKTSSGKLQRTLARSLYLDGELEGRSRKGQPAAVVKETVKSQLSYLRLALFGKKKK